MKVITEVKEKFKLEDRLNLEKDQVRRETLNKKVDAKLPDDLKEKDAKLAFLSTKVKAFECIVSIMETNKKYGTPLNGAIAFQEFSKLGIIRPAWTAVTNVENVKDIYSECIDVSLEYRQTLDNILELITPHIVATESTTIAEAKIYNEVARNMLTDKNYIKTKYKKGGIKT